MSSFLRFIWNITEFYLQNYYSEKFSSSSWPFVMTSVDPKIWMPAITRVWSLCTSDIYIMYQLTAYSFRWAEMAGCHNKFGVISNFGAIWFTYYFFPIFLNFYRNNPCYFKKDVIKIKMQNFFEHIYGNWTVILVFFLHNFFNY